AGRTGSVEARAADEEDVRPPVVVVVQDRGAAPGRLEDVLLLALPPDHGPGGEPGGGGEIHEAGGLRAAGGGQDQDGESQAKSHTIRKKALDAGRESVK